MTAPSVQPAGAPRRCTDGDRDAVLSVIADGARAYAGVIPADRWHEPYLPAAELDRELAAGVVFWGVDDAAGALVGVMGVQPVRDVSLVRHAYVRTAAQRGGVGGRLLDHLLAITPGPVLVGTWAAADWAVAFYRRHGFRQVDRDEAVRLLGRYWDVPPRQVETSVVLVHDPAGGVGTRS